MWEKRKQLGFTIIELLIVIVVIAILAAIIAVVYSGVQNRAHDSSVQNILAQFAKKYELYKIESPSGLYPAGNVPMGELGIRVANKASFDTSSGINYNLLNCTGTPAGINYALLAISKSGKKYYVSSAGSGVQEYTGPSAWGDVTMCSSVLASSVGNGAGYASAGGWRSWTN